MENKIIVEGKTIKAALKKASEKLSVPVKYLQYKIIEKGSDGFLGVFSKNYKIIVSEKEFKTSDLPGVEKALQTAQKLDGYFDVDIKDNEVYVLVYPPKGQGREVNTPAVLHYLKGIDAENIDEAAVDLAVLQKNGKPVKVAKRKPIPQKDSYAKIELSADMMQAHISIIPPEGNGRHITKSDILKRLHKEGIVFGINENVIESMIKQKTFNERVCIAEGKEPIPGENSKINLKFEPDKLLPNFEKDDYGKVDLKEMNLFQTVQKGDIVAEKIPATKGIQGKRIDGRIIPAKDGYDIPVKHGEKVVFEEATGNLKAAVAGQPIIKDDKILIEEILTINGDVNYSTGNINFDGTVIIKGRVEDNFKVIATGDIYVGKNVGKAYLKSGRNIKITGGIIGKEQGTVHSQRDVYARFVEQANITALRNIIISEVCLHSQIDSGANIVLFGKRGQLAGGITRAASHIIAKDIGAAGAPHTKLVAGIDPSFLNEIQDYEIQLIETIDVLKKINDGLSKLTKEKDGGYWNSKMEEEYKRLLNTKEDLNRREQHVHNLIFKAREKTGKNKDSSISASNKVFIGVNFEINRIPFVVSKQEYQFVTFKAKDNRIEFLPFDSHLVKKILKKDDKKTKSM